MQETTIITLAYLVVCVVVIGALVACILCGHNGALVTALIGISISVFGANLWQIIRSRRK